jgi:hypothetical protein
MRALVVAVVIGMLASGCLRNKFDLCAQLPPDPNCAYLDASTDASADAGLDASIDAATTD